MKSANFVLLSTTLFAQTALAQQFTDGTFLDSQWSMTKLIDTTPGASAAYSGIRGSGGLPGDCRRIGHGWHVVPAGVSILFAHMKSAVEYSPATFGSLKSVLLAIDARCDSAPLVNAIGFGPVLSQGSRWFTAPGSAAALGQDWIHIETTVHAIDWIEIGGNGKPDFSASGATIKVGFFSSNGGSNSDQQITATGRVDNFLARFNRSCPADLNADGLVDDSDFSVFAAAYNLLDCADPAMPAGCASDLSSDGFVDDADFSLFAIAYDELLCP